MTLKSHSGNEKKISDLNGEKWAEEMAQGLLFSQEYLSSDPRNHILRMQCWETEMGRYQGSLASQFSQSLSSRFREKLCLKK